MALYLHIIFKVYARPACELNSNESGIIEFCFDVLAEKSLSMSFEVGPDGAELQFYDSMIEFPKGALHQMTTITLSIMKTRPPDKHSVSPVIHFQCEPKVKYRFEPKVKITFPLSVYPINLEDNSDWPQVLLMCFREGLWTEIDRKKMELLKMTFECSHFCRMGIAVEEQDRQQIAEVRAIQLFEQWRGPCLELRVSICANEVASISVSN